MSFFGPHNPMPWHGQSWAPPSSQSGPSFRDTVSGWGNSARNWASGLAQGAANRLRPNSPAPGYWTNPSLASGTAPSVATSSNQSFPWSSAGPSTGSNGSFNSQPSGPPPAYTPTPTTQPQQQSLAPTQSQPMTIPSTIPPGDASIQSAVQTAVYTDGDKRGFAFHYDATKIPLNRELTNSIADENGKVHYTSIMTITDKGVKHWDIYSGVPPPGAPGTTGPGQTVTGPSGTNVTNTTNPTQTQTSEPQLEHLPSFMEIVSDQHPDNWVYGVPPADLSGVGSSKGQPLGKKGKKYSQILLEKGKYTASGFDEPRQTLENTTTWIQDRYREMLPANWSNPWGDRAGERLLNRHQARNLAVQFLDQEHDNSEAREYGLVSWMDDYVSQSIFSDTSIAFSNAPRPTVSNGLGSATSLAFDGSRLSDWAVRMVGPPESGAGTVFSKRQMDRMMDFIDTAQSYGDDLCERAGLDPEETSIVSSQVGTALATEVAISRHKSAHDDQKQWAYGNLYGWHRQMSNLSDDDRETYVSIASGKLTIDEINSYIQSMRERDTTAASASAPATATNTAPATATNPGTNSTFSNSTNASMDDRMRDDYANWQRAQQQQQPQTQPQYTNSYNIPSQMQTGSGFQGANPDGRGPNTNVRSALKGARDVAFNNQTEFQPYWKDRPPTATQRGVY